MSRKYTSQVLSSNDEETLLLLTFLMIGLYSSYESCNWFDIDLFASVRKELPADLLSKKL